MRSAAVCFAALGACLFPIALAACENLSGLNTDAPDDANASRDGSGSGEGGKPLVDGSALTDAPSTEPSCDLASPFQTPVLVGGLTNTTPRGARLLPDERTAVTFVVVGGNNLMIGSATRQNVADAFGPATPFSSLGSGDSTNDPAPTLSADGKTIVFSRIASNRDSLFIATRQGTGDDFSTPTALPPTINGPSFTVEFPYLRPDGNVLYFSRYQPPGGDRAIFRSEKAGTSFGTPQPVTEINSPSPEFSVVVTEDELTIFWSSVRPDLFAKGGTDIFMATRTSAQQPFTNIRNVSELNTNDTDDPQWVSPDGCRLYFTSLSGGATNVLMAKHAPK